MSQSFTPENEEAHFCDSDNSSSSDLRLDLVANRYASIARKEWHEKKKSCTKINAPGSLLEITAQYIGKNMPFELIDSSNTIVPEELQELISFHSFPTDEQNIWLYSVLSCGGAHEFLRGEELWSGSSVSDCIQIGFNLNATVISKKKENLKRSMTNCDYVVHQVSLFFDRGKITKCFCTCITDLGENDPGGPMNNPNGVNKPTSSTIFLGNKTFNCSLNTASSILYHMRNKPLIGNNENDIERCFSNHKKTRLPKRNIWSMKALSNSTHFGEPLMEPFVDPMICNGVWCSHIVAVCLTRIREPHLFSRRPPISESLSKMTKEQLQKFAQNLIMELEPKRILPKAQHIIDQLFDTNDNPLKNCPGAPDPTLGGGFDHPANWSLDTVILKDKILLTLQRFSTVKSKIFTDVNSLNDSMHFEAEEISTITESFHIESYKGIWDFILIIEKMLKNGDCNAVPLLEILTRRVFAVEEIIKGWYIVQVNALSFMRSANRNKQTIWYSSAWLCESIINLWKMAILKITFQEKNRKSPFVDEKKIIDQINWKLIKEDIPLSLYNKSEINQRIKTSQCDNLKCRIIDRLKLFHCSCIEQINIAFSKNLPATFDIFSLFFESNGEDASSSSQNNSAKFIQKYRMANSEYELLEENCVKTFSGFLPAIFSVNSMSFFDHFPQVFLSKDEWLGYLPFFDGALVQSPSNKLDELLSFKEGLRKSQTNTSCDDCKMRNRPNFHTDSSYKDTEIYEYTQKLDKFFTYLEEIFIVFDEFQSIDSESGSLGIARMASLILLNKGPELIELLQEICSIVISLLGKVIELRKQIQLQSAPSTNQTKPHSSISQNRSSGGNNDKRYRTQFFPSHSRKNNSNLVAETAAQQIKRENTLLCQNYEFLITSLCDIFSNGITKIFARILSLSNVLLYKKSEMSTPRNVSTKEWFDFDLNLTDSVFVETSNTPDIQLALRILFFALSMPKLPCNLTTIDLRIFHQEIDIFNRLAKISIDSQDEVFDLVMSISNREMDRWKNIENEETATIYLTVQVPYLLLTYFFCIIIEPYSNEQTLANAFSEPATNRMIPTINSNLMYNLSSPIKFYHEPIDRPPKIRTKDQIEATFDACLNSLRYKSILTASFSSEQVFWISVEVQRLRHRVLLLKMVSHYLKDQKGLSKILNIILDKAMNPQFNCLSLDSILLVQSPTEFAKLAEETLRKRQQSQSSQVNHHPQVNVADDEKSESIDLEEKSENPLNSDEDASSTLRNRIKKDFKTSRTGTTSSDEASDNLSDGNRNLLANVKASIQNAERRLKDSTIIDSSAPETTSSGEVSPNLRRKKFLNNNPLKSQFIKDQVLPEVTEETSAKLNCKIDCEDDDSSVISQPEEKSKLDHLTSSLAQKKAYLGSIVKAITREDYTKGPIQSIYQNVGQTSCAGYSHIILLGKSMLYMSRNYDADSMVFVANPNGFNYPQNGGEDPVAPLAAFIIYLYGLGVTNRWSQVSWFFRTYNKTSKLIHCEVMRIGWRAACILLHTWDNHLTPTELSTIAFRCIDSDQPFMKDLGYELSISCLKACLLMNPNDVVRILDNCSINADLLIRALEEATLAYSTSSVGEILPELLFHIAKFWEKVYKNANVQNSRIYLENTFTTAMEGLKKVFKKECLIISDMASNKVLMSTKQTKSSHNHRQYKGNDFAQKAKSQTMPLDESREEMKTGSVVYEMLTQNEKTRFYKEQIIFTTDIACLLGTKEMKELSELLIASLKCPLIMELIVKKLKMKYSIASPPSTFCQLQPPVIQLHHHQQQQTQNNIYDPRMYPQQKMPVDLHPNYNQTMGFYNCPTYPTEVNTRVPPPPIFHPGLCANPQPVIPHQTLIQSQNQNLVHQPTPSTITNQSPAALMCHLPPHSQVYASPLDPEYLKNLEKLINRMHTLFHMNIEHQMLYLTQSQIEWDQLVDLLLKAYNAQIHHPPSNKVLVWSNLITKIYKHPKCSSILWNRISSALQLSEDYK